MQIAKILIFLTIFSNSYAKDIINNSFITKYEYGAMLYENPRGIGCDNCHGKGDKINVIAKYKDRKGIIKFIKAPAINKTSFETFVNVLTSNKNQSSVMPTYFLTNDEIKSIYYYLTNLKK